jgi:predicted nucleic acid-binding protein
MEKKRAECHVLESAQEHINTDAKASERLLKSSPNKDMASHHSEQDPISAPAPVRKCGTSSKGRSPAEVKALMEKKRGECHVLESAQEHINTDAKASERLLKFSPNMDMASHHSEQEPISAPAPVRKCGTTSKELKDLMSRLSNQCEISESTQEFVATDAKSNVLLSSPDTENIVHGEDKPVTARADVPCSLVISTVSLSDSKFRT